MIFFRECDILGYPTCPSRNDLDTVIEIKRRNRRISYKFEQKIQVHQRDKHATVENN